MKYPFCMVFLLIEEFSERFAFYGVMSMLSIYLHVKLGYEEDRSTVIFHVFNALSYFTTIFGAIAADSWLGKYRLITSMIIVYTTGFVLLTFASLPFMYGVAREITIASLFIAAVGIGSIKPCVAAFGGDQFKVPEQNKQLSKFFSIFYFSINCGSLTSMAISPVLRGLHCFGEHGCYPVAFGLNTVAIIVAAVSFLLGKHWYIIKKPTGNMFVNVSKCVGHAIKQKYKLKGTEPPKKHWLDYAEEKYGAQMIADIKVLFNVLILFLPIPVFWALFDQQGSRWTFQATRMNGELGFFTLMPEHVMVMNPILVLIFIPLCQFALYPFMAKFKLATDLRKFIIGGFLAALAFVISGFIEIKLQSTYPVLPYKGNAQIRIFNGYDSDVYIKFDKSDTAITIKALGLYVDKEISVEGSITKTFKVSPKAEVVEPEEGEEEEGKEQTIEVNIEEESAMSVLIYPGGLKYYSDDVDKSSNGLPAVRILFVAPSAENITSSVKVKDHYTGEIVKTAGVDDIELGTVPASTYDVEVDGKNIISDYKMSLGGVCTIIVAPQADGTYKANVQTIAEPNNMHMLWLLPQAAAVSLGEVMFSITGLEFCFSESPESMKSVLQACWLLTITVGNIIVVIVAETKVIDQQYIEFFLFAALMCIDMGIFMILAKRYTPMKPQAQTAE